MQRKTASFLFQLTKKDATFVMSDETLKAFDDLRKCLLTAPKLIFPNFTKEFEFFCDASKFAIGAALTQRLEVIHPVSYASRQFNNKKLIGKRRKRRCLQSFGHQCILKHTFTVNILCSTQITNRYRNYKSRVNRMDVFTD